MLGAKEENGRITAARIKFDRGFMLSVHLTFEFEGSGQGFGGWVLGGNPFDGALACQHATQKNLAAEFIGGVMAVAGVEDWADLRGTIMRVRREGDDGRITSIGHAFKNMWFDPKARLGALTGESEAA